MKIGFFELEGWEEKIVRETFSGHEVRFSNMKITEQDLPPQNDFDVLSVFVDSRITPAVLTHFPSVKLITTRSTGFDHVDVAACKAKGISVASVPGYGDNTVAEFAFGLMLNLSRKLYQAIDQIKEIESFSQKGLRGFDLKGKTLGVVGTGRIGKEVIKIAKGFGMEVIAFDPFPNAETALALGFTYFPLEGLLGKADIITLHCPLTDITKHLINRKNIGMIKKGAYLINTARGGIVETDALVEALEKGILAGAGLDVLEEEGETKDEMRFLSENTPHEKELKTILQNHILMNMPNVIITPHNAFNSQEALERILSTTLENIAGFIAGTPKNIIP
ncbi:MAG: NAD(P)-dependent oxidoreductase [Candidatus Paceibacterota bacterium]|jgi:D-lactate dehydrogenase